MSFPDDYDDFNAEAEEMAQADIQAWLEEGGER